MAEPAEITAHDIHRVQMTGLKGGLQWHQLRINGQLLNPMKNGPDGLKYLHHGHADMKSYMDEVW